MASIWIDTSAGTWDELTPTGFADEAELHDMVFRSVGMLPLSGSPVVVALAQEMEVPFTKGRVDVVAVETDGTPVLIEVKLAQNAEARKAVVSQVLSYAASLRGTTPKALQSRLTAAGFSAPSISARVLESAPIVESEFEQQLEQSLSAGRFRLVFVLDEAPPELVRLVGYLEALSGGLLAIDLITVSTFHVGDRRVAVPQRLDPERLQAPPEGAQDSRAPAQPVISEPGAALFEASFATATPPIQTSFIEMAAWAKKIADRDLAKLVSRQGLSRTVLTLRVKNEESGLVSLWNSAGQPYLWLHGTVAARCAPNTFEALAAHFGKEVGSRRGIRWSEVAPELLELLQSGYEEAAALNH